MKYLIFIVLVAFSCRDQYPVEPAPCDASRIEGVWHDAQQSPYWYYEFHYPRLRQWVEFGGSIVTEQFYIYGTSADTLWASGPGGSRVWRICFPTDSTAEYHRWDVWKWSPAYTLKRLE